MQGRYRVIFAIVLAEILGIVVGLLLEGITAQLITIAGVLAGGTVIVALSGWMTITIDDENFAFQMGIGPVGRRIPLDELQSWSSVRNNWLYGWGIRLYRRG